jgi:uncharacterized membrane protein YphA (DoxX/SURF4 family)
MHAQVFAVGRGLVGPALDLAVRLILARGFLVSAWLKIGNWPAALYLAHNEYRLSWMNPVSAAYSGVAIELVCPLLLAAGLLTRYAAVPMLILSLVVQFNYNPIDSQLFSAALFAWYTIHGAGPWSLDRRLRRGRIPRGSQWVRAQLSAQFLALLRIWIALALLLAGLHVNSVFGQSILRVELLLPLTSLPGWPAVLSLACGALLLAGLATRYLAIILIIVSAGTAMMHSSFADDVYFAAVLAVLALFGGGRPSADAALRVWGCEQRTLGVN